MNNAIPNPTYIERAERLKPTLHRDLRRPLDVVAPERNPTQFQGWSLIRIGPAEALAEKKFFQGDSIILDFGDYLVGSVKFDVAILGISDGPTRMTLTFAEVPIEICEPMDPFKGGLSRAWLQDEVVQLDDIPAGCHLARRYAFRYLKIDVTGSSTGSPLQILNLVCETVTSADPAYVLPTTIPAEFRAIAEVGLSTLKWCMQTVFEDGPKRDRRLWLGDLRLQALANYQTYRNFDLVRRCLYIFAAFSKKNELMMVTHFENPALRCGHCAIYDYAALFAPTLLEYAEASGDWETARELWPLALDQMRFVLGYLADHLFVDPKKFWVFIDWRAELHRDTATQGILIFGLKALRELARRLGMEGEAEIDGVDLDKMISSCREKLRDPETGLYVSGPEKQVSWASQAWMVIAGVMTPEEGREALLRLMKDPHAVRPAGPYLYHYVVEALDRVGLREEALRLMQDYWGGMVRAGAQTFWEVYDPAKPRLSPYENAQLNSHCHAWSCTPVYFLCKWFV